MGLGYPPVETLINLQSIELDQSKKSERDPFLTLGFGMLAYFKMLKVLIIVFLIISLLGSSMCYLYAR
jgi:hypothetical protein